MSTDRFGGYADTVTAPSRRWAPITPHDTDALPEIPKAISNEGSPGFVFLVGEDGTVASFFLAQGQERPLRARVVKAEGMTAGMDLRALF